MNETISVNMKNLTDTEREQLMNLVKKASEEKKSKEWTPNYNENVYVINSCGGIVRWKYCDNPIDKYTFELGNVFRTEEEAKEEIMRRKILNKWKRLSIEAGEDENPWNTHKRHWYVYYNSELRELHTSYDDENKSESVYFQSEKSLKNAIQIIGGNNVKEYILGVKE